MLYHWYTIRSSTEGKIRDFEDMMQVTLKDDNLGQFDADFETRLMGCQNPPGPDELYWMYYRQISKSHKIKEEIRHYDRLEGQDHPDRSFEFLKRTVRNYEARIHRKNFTEAARLLNVPYWRLKRTLDMAMAQAKTGSTARLMP